MSESSFQYTTNGQELQGDDLNALSETARLADDRLGADLVRMAPYNGSSVLKAILPSGHASSTAATVEPTGSADGSVRVNPFRAIIGSRTALATDTKKNYRDIKSWVFVNGATTLHQVVAIAANASGNPRWDLVYATFTEDVLVGGVTRKVKNPAGTAVTPTSISQRIAQTVAIGVFAGTPAASPNLPATPADSAGVYQVPLAYVRVNNGHTAGTTIATKQMLMAEPCTVLARATGAQSLRPANQQYKLNGSALTTARIQTWGAAAANERPGYVIPPGMQGGESILVALDLKDASSANWSHQHLGIIDDSVDWRKRTFRWNAFVRNHATAKHVFDATAVATDAMVPQVEPDSGAATTTVPSRTGSGFGQSFQADANAAIAGGCYVAILKPIVYSEIAAATNIQLIVDASGVLKLFVVGVPLCKVFLWVDASAPMPNY